MTLTTPKTYVVFPLCLLLSFSCSSPQNSALSGKPNTLLIYADDLTAKPGTISHGEAYKSTPPPPAT